jgi:hypothetical protein
MNFAKKVLMLVVLVAMAMPIVGCGVATSPEENSRALSRVADYDARMMVDDLQLFLQIDRPLRNSRWVLD